MTISKELQKDEKVSQVGKFSEHKQEIGAYSGLKGIYIKYENEASHAKMRHTYVARNGFQ